MSLLVMFRLLMNVIKNVLSYIEVQRPAKATSIHSLMIYLYASPPLFLNHQPLERFAPQKCQSESKELIHSVSICRTCLGFGVTLKLLHRCHFVTSFPQKVNMKDYGELCAAIKIHKVWILLRK